MKSFAEIFELVQSGKYGDEVLESLYELCRFEQDAQGLIDVPESKKRLEAAIVQATEKLGDQGVATQFISSAAVAGLCRGVLETLVGAFRSEEKTLRQSSRFRIVKLEGELQTLQSLLLAALSEASPARAAALKKCSEHLRELLAGAVLWLGANEPLTAKLDARPSELLELIGKASFVSDQLLGEEVQAGSDTEVISERIGLQ